MHFLDPLTGESRFVLAALALFIAYLMVREVCRAFAPDGPEQTPAELTASLIDDVVSGVRCNDLSAEDGERLIRATRDAMGVPAAGEKA